MSRRFAAFLFAPVALLVRAGTARIAPPRSSRHSRGGLPAAFLLGVAMFALARAEPLNLQTATIADLNRAFEAGTLTSEQLVRASLARIEAYDKSGPKLNAILALAPNALQRARELDAERTAGKVRSPLHGIPFVVKDTVDTIDAPTAGACLGFANTFPAADSAVVRKLKAAGAIMLGKANCDEFNNGSEGLSSLGGQTINPYDPKRNPGGSSAGSAVAVNCGFAVLAIAAETGASIRSPASNNSIVALAPTTGLFSRAGVLASSYTQDRVGPHGRSVADVALMATFMAGFDATDMLTHASLGKIPSVPYTSFLDKNGLRGARIGVFRDLFRQGAEFEEINGLIEKQIVLLGEQGAVVMDGLTTGIDLIKFIPLARTNGEFGEAFRSYLAARGSTVPIHSAAELVASGKFLQKLGNGLKQAAERPDVQFDAGYLARLKNRETVRKLLVDLMDRYQVDVLVHPFKSLGAPPLGTGDRGPRDNPFSAITGLPALVVPAGVNSEGLPIAIEFLGRPFSEPTLFKIGYAYEQASQLRTPPRSTPPLAGETIALPGQ